MSWRGLFNPSQLEVVWSLVISSSVCWLLAVLPLSAYDVWFSGPLWVLSSIIPSVPLLQIAALRLPRGYQGKCSLLCPLSVCCLLWNNSSTNLLQRLLRHCCNLSGFTIFFFFLASDYFPLLGGNILYVTAALILFMMQSCHFWLSLFSCFIRELTNLFEAESCPFDTRF